MMDPLETQLRAQKRLEEIDKFVIAERDVVVLDAFGDFIGCLSSDELRTKYQKLLKEDKEILSKKAEECLKNIRRKPKRKG